MGSYRNIMEEIVLANVDNVLKNTGCCSCDACRTDVITYTLNHLPPKYVTTEKGALLTSIDACVAQNAVDIVFSINQSAMYIKKHPKHPPLK